jgi:hypothetical protein
VVGIGSFEPGVVVGMASIELGFENFEGTDGCVGGIWTRRQLLQTPLGGSAIDALSE